MSKYDALWRYLQTSGQTQLTLTFDEIAALAGTALDHSFLTCKKELPAYGYAVGRRLLRLHRGAERPTLWKRRGTQAR